MVRVHRISFDLGQRERAEVKLGGFGGQGIILAGMILGRAATVYAGRNAVMNQSFGPASRGGACVAEIIIADEEISYPRGLAADVLVMMSQEAYDTYGTHRSPQSLLIVDEDLVKLDEGLERGKPVLRAPATRLAEGLGRRMVANVVMLGFLCGATQLVSAEAMREAVATSVPKGTEELNLKAFDAGHDYASNAQSDEEEGARL